MKVRIERSDCTSCGTCRDTCPQFFEMDPDDSFSRVMEKFRLAGNVAEGTAPPDMEACVTEAADLCPVSIITTEN